MGMLVQVPYFPPPTASSAPPLNVGLGGRTGPSDLVLRALARAVPALRRYGWFGFWFQLILSTVSGVVLLFSVGFTSKNGSRVSLYLTLFGILAGFLSAFWNYSYTRTASRMQATLIAAVASGAADASTSSSSAYPPSPPYYIPFVDPLSAYPPLNASDAAAPPPPPPSFASSSSSSSS
eukprot:CAMPEP_0175055012 /NCGR_PEP_ID=MMETSP0052_2-20121109/9834_1 /TAXON_ID=51329 ORGANISM="Polytomella parva, Strain SAG 63-3" /NCGR_SAMPLE_ID=MMETSP0052_2 /ASSEMBLY_ACC=CAM_ASM_000194 /LENGTH=178 /DNA_ID=CAMNT_0016319791 /DNA_START=271 /DNA_END=806 /DNA_ORIENTATION=+